MKKTCLPILLLLAGCAGGDELSRMTSQMMWGDMRQRHKGQMQSLDEFSAPAVRYYYSKRYTASPAQIAAAQTAGKKVVSVAAKKNRYVAVSVPRSEKSEGAVDIMVFDRIAEKLAGVQVYSLEKTPARGELIELFGTSATERVRTRSVSPDSPLISSVFVGGMTSE